MITKNILFDREIMKLYRNGLDIEELAVMFTPLYSEDDIHEMLYREEWVARELSKDQYSTKQSVHLMEAFEIFDELVYDMCMANIVNSRESDERREHFKIILNKYKSWKRKDDQLMVHQAKEYPIHNLVQQFSEQEVTYHRNIICPLHEDSTPSFRVYPNNVYKCFGCGEFGDTISFLMKKRGIDFISAVKWLTNS